MIDVWDMICLAGLSLVTVGIAFIHWQSGLIFAGVSLVTIYAVREYASNVPVPRNPEDDGAAGGE